VLRWNLAHQISSLLMTASCRRSLRSALPANRSTNTADTCNQGRASYSLCSPPQGPESTPTASLVSVRGRC